MLTNIILLQDDTTMINKTEKVQWPHVFQFSSIIVYGKLKQAWNGANKYIHWLPREKSMHCTLISK